MSVCKTKSMWWGNAGKSTNWQKSNAKLCMRNMQLCKCSVSRISVRPTRRWNKSKLLTWGTGKKLKDCRTKLIKCFRKWSSSRNKLSTTKKLWRNNNRIYKLLNRNLAKLILRKCFVSWISTATNKNKLCRLSTSSKSRKPCLLWEMNLD